MISWLNGIVTEKAAPSLVLNVQGVGYEVFVPMSSFVSLPVCGAEVSIYTHMLVREDAQLLYGFLSKQERELFQTLLKVNGVGAKMALNVLSAMDTQEFVQCVRDKNITALVKLPGVGKKTAERLVIELLDRLKDWTLANDLFSSGAGEQGSSVPSEYSVEADALAALMSLGYKEADAQKAIKAALKIETFENSESLIRAALRSHVR